MTATSSNSLRCVGTRSSKNSPWPSRPMSMAKSLGSIQDRSPWRQRDAISRTFRRAPIAANLDSMLLAFIRFDLWFQTVAHRAKRETQFHRAGSDDAIWFIALAKEQLALIAANGLHRAPFL